MKAATTPSRVNPVYPFRRPDDFDGRERHYPVCVVGAGPVGLAAAIDLKLRGVDVLLVDEGDTVSAGSRLICLAKRSLEIFARLGIGAELAAKGVVWN
ncbi:MAG: FAD-dependent oxidoreductase, partial [Alphaproteobacteria bacterium]|nr:FAD-dependent oxidoreductase [Alphaproteobacteria bacterium]